jgi:2-polyprenyl-3-methyl-5-hydroxy-6-metoxy-1,4-benzoquinol methylase
MTSHHGLMDSTADADRARQRDLVRAGYDAISRRYRSDDGVSNADSAETTADYGAWLAELDDRLPVGARVLDLGCGAGVPTAKVLADAGFEVTGVDISVVQIERARSLVPNATFIHADMAAWNAPPASFHAVVSLYALIHVPLDDQRTLIPRIARWLGPGGYLLAIVGHEQWTGIAEYMGAPMFWDHADADTYLTWLHTAGFDVLWHRYIAEGTSGHTLLLAQVG